MPKAKKYQILVAFNIESLEEKVNNSLFKGWELHEGLVIRKTKDPNFPTEYYQIMVWTKVNK